MAGAVDDVGDHPLLEPAGQEIVWQESLDVAAVIEPGIRLWSGEVLFTTGRGVSGPFCVSEAAARAWAIAAAGNLAAADVFSAQIASVVVGESMAGELLSGGDAAYRRINRFEASPVRPDEVLPVALPGRPHHFDPWDD